MRKETIMEHDHAWQVPRAEEHWRYQHNRALREPIGPEVGIMSLRYAIGQYVLEAELASGADGSGQWRDTVLGPAVGKLLEAFLVLLNGDLGRLDPGTLDQWARGMAERVGYNMDSGEYGS